ncbi:hypothetical protein GQ53DRAFT_764496 [Thozetella sp. PMI_491]|nr:hypothetical protein GQ53DRAFT_764496 [Thozetella sp. PMI_491]
MSGQGSIRDLANIRLQDHFARNRDSDYDDVQVLLLYWNQSDLEGFKEEADKLEVLFGKRFRYSVQRYEIPSGNSQLLLDIRIGTFLTSILGPRTLGIIHYGGHGDDDAVEGNRERRSVWAGHGTKGTDGDSDLVWSEIQPKLGIVKGDILLLLDCCFAAQAARDRDRVIPGNVELVAACAMKLGTPAPTQAQSFTMTLIREIERALDEQRAVIVKEVHGRLSRADRGLVQSPLYYPPQSNKSIRLDPLPTPRAAPLEIASLGSLTLQLDVGIPISQALLEDISAWLVLNSPRDITRVEITEMIDRATKLCDFVANTDVETTDSAIRMAKLSDISKQEVRAALSDFNTNVALSAKVAASKVDTSTKTMVVQGFLDAFKTRVSTLQRVVARNVLGLPELFDEGVLQKEARVNRADSLGISEALDVRLVACMEDTPNAIPIKTIPGGNLTQIDGAANTLFAGRLAEVGTVLVEYKHFDSQDSNDLRGRVGLVFRHTHNADQGAVSLYRALQPQISRKARIQKPTLGERYLLALTIGRALLQWHLVGWVHQGIASYNVIFFEAEPGVPEYARPCLLGFEYSREYDATSLQRQAHMGTMADQYRHPDRQGERPPRSQTKLHDIYSFGLLLVEIGLWRPLDQTFKELLELRGTKELRAAILKKGQGLLSHSMGLAYETIALLCLSGNFGITLDDKQETVLARMFETQVLATLEVATKAGLDTIAT